MYINVLEFLERNAANIPDKLALKDEKNSVTYSELEEKAKLIGYYIAQKYTQKNSPIAVCIDRNIESVILFLGILYSGNFYVPIDFTMPRERIRLIMEDLRPVMILASDGNMQEDEITANYEEIIKEAYILKSESGKCMEKVLENIRNHMIDTDPLYAIYTSGSTGRPKGVVVSHRSVIDLVEQFAVTFPFPNDVIIGNQAPFDFDVSVKDIYNTLFQGGTMAIIPKHCFSMPLQLISYLNENEINTVIWAVSAMRIVENFKTFSKLVPKYLKLIMFSGEVMPVKVLNYWRQHVDTVYVNLYGPTEITCNCSYYIVDREFQLDEPLPIGKAFRNTEILLVDNEKKSVISKADVKGEICVRGTCLAHGYYNSPEKTEKAFVQSVVHNNYLERIYHTGDMGYYNMQGELMFASRQDFQIKHMGHRIELGEIEVVVNAVEGLDAGVCVYDTKHEKIVLCYQCDKKAADESAVKKKIVAGLKEKLPKYMWPNRYVQYEQLPLNKNGKIDRVVLKQQYESAE